MTQCRQCGTMLPEPLPKFCPQCGAPVAPVSPFPPSQPAVNPGAAWATHRQSLIATGLFVLGFLMGGAPAVSLLGLAWLVAIPLIVLDALGLPFMAQLPAFLRRPNLGAAVSLLAIVTTAVPAGITLGWFALAGGTYMWLKEAARRGETVIGPFDFRLSGYGWRRWLLVGIVLAAFTFAASWEPWTYVSGYSYTTRSGGWEYTYRVPGSEYDPGSGMGTGAATVPALLMSAVVLWSAYVGRGGQVPAWFRYVPAIVSPVLILLAVRHFGVAAWTQNYRDTVVTSPPGGPYLFVILLIPFYLAAFNLARGKNHWKAGM
jgi:hypothetical protein